MTPEKETPAPLCRLSDGEQGLDDTGGSLAVPGWARKHRGASLVRFRGQYLTPEAVNLQARVEAVQGRVGRLGPDAALPAVSLGSVPSQVAGDSPNAQMPPRMPPYEVVEGAPKPASRSEGLPAGGWAIDPLTGECLPLPCRSLESTQSKPGRNGLTGAHKKTALALSWNVAHLGEKYGAERLGFLTLTFADHVTCAREASRRFNSLATNILKQRYADYIRVLERQKSGRIHYHLLVVLDEDIKTGFDHAAVAAKDYASAGKRIRLEWAFWRKTAPVYRFGRTELMPVKSNSDALAQYVGKYIGKHFNEREERDKGVRLVSYSRGARMASQRFTSTNKAATDWRRKLHHFVIMTRCAFPAEPVTGFASLRRIYGPRWGYHWRDFILSLEPLDLAVPF